MAYGCTSTGDGHGGGGRPILFVVAWDLGREVSCRLREDDINDDTAGRACNFPFC